MLVTKTTRAALFLEVLLKLKLNSERFEFQFALDSCECLQGLNKKPSEFTVLMHLVE